MRKVAHVLAVSAAIAVAGCGGSADSGGQGADQRGRGDSASACTVPGDLVRRSDVPIGVLAPSGSLRRQSYTSGADVAAAGLNAVSLGLAFYYDASGGIVFDFDGNADEAAKGRWVEELRCSVVEAKNADLMVAVWGQFIEAGSRGEPGEISPDIQSRVLEGALALVPEIGTILEELKVEYWAPVSELERFAGIANHNDYFPRMVAAGRPVFEGTIYVQPNILQRDGFAAAGVEPDLGGADALGISWISYECEPAQLPPNVSVETADYYLDAASAQGISRVFISELGGTRMSGEEARPCFEQLIERWNGADNGVFVLDMPSDQPGGATVRGNWQEQVLATLRG